jgi:hypothetical protein
MPITTEKRAAQVQRFEGVHMVATRPGQDSRLLPSLVPSNGL